MFKTTAIDYASTGKFSKTLIDYLAEHINLSPFYKYKVDIHTFKQVIKDKQYPDSFRPELANALKQQYEGLNIQSPLALKNIDLLEKANTFTVCTAHQLNLFTGPLYVIFKAISCINLSKQLKSTYPTYHFVPIFWLGSEDHDLEEINHLHLFNKKVEWTTKQTGATGKMQLTGISQALDETFQILGDSEQALYLKKTLSTCFTENKTLQDASTHFLDALFGEYGLVIVNADQPALKKIFVAELQAEVFEHVIENKVNAINEQLGKHYKIQATPRQINLFYLKDDVRERIIWDEGKAKYNILNTSLSFSKEEIETELKQHPERFSPNVLMRPLYQEKILPNLAYIGGGGELAYWLELKSTFEKWNINYPMLILRNSAMFIEAKQMDKWKQLGFTIDDLFQPEHDLSVTLVNNNEGKTIDFKPYLVTILQTKDAILQEGQSIDNSLGSSIDAEFTKIEKSLNNLEQKFMRAAKRRHSDSLNQISALQSKLFPKKGLQERYDNFMQYYLKHGDAFFELLLNHFNCLEQQFLIFVEE